MKSYAKKICAAIGGSLLVASSLVPLACTSVACTSSRNEEHSDSSASPESSPSVIPFADLQAQANLIDNVDDAIKFLNQALAKYYTFDVFNDWYKSSMKKRCGPDVFTKPSINISQNDENGYAWCGDLIGPCIPHEDQQVCFPLYEDWMYYDKLIDKQNYCYRFGRLTQNKIGRFNSCLVKDIVTGDVSAGFELTNSVFNNEGIAYTYYDDENYEINTLHDWLVTEDNKFANVIKIENFPLDFPLLKGNKNPAIKSYIRTDVIFPINED